MPVLLPFERVEAAALAIDQLLDNHFGKCELPPHPAPEVQTPNGSDSDGDGPQASPRLGLQEYRTKISQTDTYIQTNSLRISSLQRVLAQAQLLQHQLELCQTGLVSSRDQLLLSLPSSARTQLPIEVICKIFSYIFPLTNIKAVKALHSNPWKDVLLQTTLIDMRCDDMLNSEGWNAWKAETIARAYPAGLSVLIEYDSAANTGAGAIEAIAPHLGRARNLELIRFGHESCGPLQRAVKDSLRGEKLRLENLTMNLKHAQCLADCISPTTLSHLYLVDSPVFPTIQTAQSLLCIVQATPNLRTFTLTCQSLTLLPLVTQPEPIPLPKLHRLRFRAPFSTTTLLVKFFSETLDTPSVREFHAQFFFHPRMLGPPDPRSPIPLSSEELVEMIDKKYPLLTHLSLFEKGRDRMAKTPTDILNILNTSAQGSEPLLRNLSSISVDKSLLSHSPVLLEDFARNRSKNPLTKTICSLDLHADPIPIFNSGSESETLEDLKRLRENILLYYPNVTFAADYFREESEIRSIAGSLLASGGAKIASERQTQGPSLASQPAPVASSSDARGSVARNEWTAMSSAPAASSSHAASGISVAPVATESAMSTARGRGSTERGKQRGMQGGGRALRGSVPGRAVKRVFK